MAHVEAPRIYFVKLIDGHRLEIYWDQEVFHGEENVEKDYRVTLRGKEIPTYHAKTNDERYWQKRAVYETIKMRTTLYLMEEVKKTDLGQIEVQLVGNIKNKDGKVADTTSSYTVKQWEDFYKQFYCCEAGILIKSSENVPREVLWTAGRIISHQLKKMPEVAAVLREKSADLAIYGESEDVYDLPEHRGGAGILGRPVEGYGGFQDNCTSSISAKNVQHITEGPNQSRYTNECILVHEFGHAIHLIGINSLKDTTLADKIQAGYQQARAKNLWPNTYLIMNWEEYFATLSTIWFNVMVPSKDNTWDGVRGPIYNRKQLKEYDPVSYQLFKEIYPMEFLPAPWNEWR